MISENLQKHQVVKTKNFKAEFGSNDTPKNFVKISFGENEWFANAYKILGNYSSKLERKEEVWKIDLIRGVWRIALFNWKNKNFSSIQEILNELQNWYNQVMSSYNQPKK